ncbi:hypothetical protein ABZ342_18545 [Amycolatopsis sp. NPDC005961]|uniref:hypothetical protein n=1 Tax=Amycolatopsis sp. NPDC005961 TaxID=3156720 RepID=UPI0033D71C11
MAAGERLAATPPEATSASWRRSMLEPADSKRRNAALEMYPRSTGSHDTAAAIRLTG